MSKRPPLLGYNHNVRHAGRLFHVQTEDSGLIRLYVTTHLFLDGTILSTARSQYTADEPDEVVQKKMQVQHKTMLKRLRDGDFDNLQDATARTHLPKAAADSGAEHAIPREVASDAAQSTLRLASPGAAAEVARPPRAPTGPILAPVAPPPLLPRPPAPTGSLAERLRRTGPPGSSPPPPPAARPPTVPAVPVVPAEPQSVLELEADLPDDEDDLEPAVTIEVAEPGPAEPVPADATLTFGAAQMPIPQPPPVTAAGPPAGLSQTGVPRGLAPAVPSAPPPGPAPVVVPLPPPPPLPMLVVRPSPSTVLRAKPTAEGVVLQRTLVPTPVLRPGADSVRTTSPLARPTAPAPLAVAQPMHPMDDERSLDPVVLAYLAREIRPRDA